MTDAAAPSVRWRVVLADDHQMVLEGLAALIAAQPDMEVVGRARNGREAVQLVEQLDPDVAVLDVSMPVKGGAEAAQTIHALRPGVRMLALTRHADQGYLLSMLRSGVTGYVVKRAASDVLIGAIRAVAEGGTYIDPTLAGAVVAQAVGRAARPAGEEPRSPLSEREEQVLRMIAWGKSNKEVGAALGISVKTAEFYKASAIGKLKLQTRTDILRHALAARWLTDEIDPD